MNEEQMKALRNVLTEAIKPLSDTITGIDTRLKAVEEGQKKQAAAVIDMTGMSAEDIKQERIEAGVVDGDDPTTAATKIGAYRNKMNKPATLRDITTNVMQIFRTAGGRPVGHSASGKGQGDGDDKVEEKWNAKVAEVQAANGMKQHEAIGFCIKRFPDLYKELCVARGVVKKGEK